LPGPWSHREISIPPGTARHLTTVLRLGAGAAVTYTDGAGHVGQGQLQDGTVVRGEESFVAPPRVEVTLAVAPPHDKDRLRFMVEKLAELEVRRLAFLQARFGVRRRPDQSKAASWAISALEQSQGSWLLEISPGWVEIGELDPENLWFADLGAAGHQGKPPARVTLAIGPEGGWDEGEVPTGATRIGLGRTVLRVETAAIVAAGMFRW
jgi:16S rRNA (uracil1498-N3)-methyltransferase